MVEIINKNIRFLREREGWTQKELAEKLGIKKSMVGAYEEFRSVPLLKTSVNIADLFNVDLESLIKEDLRKSALALLKNDQSERSNNTMQ
jgi:transcriptional regulator with XRE-family HTH domain